MEHNQALLAMLGFAILLLFMIVVIRKWATAFVAIIAIPTVLATLAGYGPELPEMMLNGIKMTAPTAVLLLFAVFYFGVMMDAKLFDPISNRLLRLSGGDPARLAAGTAILALLVAPDGDGTTSYMIICSAFLPVYRRLGLNPLVIAMISTASLGLVSGATPWGGAATRAISVLHLDASAYFLPLVPALSLTSLCIVALSYFIGVRARRNVDPALILEVRQDIARLAKETPPVTWRWYVNGGMTLALMGLLVLGVAPLPILFILGFIVALTFNLPRREDQAEFIKSHAQNAIPVVILVLAAGIFTGILSESGMTQAMAASLLAAVPDGAHHFIPALTGLIALPLSFFMSNDAFFFGVVPVLAQSAAQYGIGAEEIACASVAGQMLHMMGPTSAPLWLLLTLVGRELGEFQRYALIPVTFVSVLLLGFIILTGAISFF